MVLSILLMLAITLVQNGIPLWFQLAVFMYSFLIYIFSFLKCLAKTPVHFYEGVCLFNWRFGVLYIFCIWLLSQTYVFLQKQWIFPRNGSFLPLPQRQMVLLPPLHSRSRWSFSGPCGQENLFSIHVYLPNLFFLIPLYLFAFYDGYFGAALFNMVSTFRY